MTTLFEYFFAIPVALAALFFWTWNVYRAGFERGYKTADDDAMREMKKQINDGLDEMDAQRREAK